MSKKKVKGPTKSKAQVEEALNAQLNKPVENPELKQAMDLLAEQRTSANEKKVFELIKEASFLCPVVIDGDAKPVNGKVQLTKANAIRFVLINTQDGKVFFPAFTDVEEAKKLPAQDGEQLTYMARTFADFEQMLKGSGKVLGVVVNPASNNLVFPLGLVSKVLHEEEEKAKQEEALRRGEIPAGMRVSYYEPSVYPTALANAVYDACQELEHVSRVWLKGVHLESATGFALFLESEQDDPSIHEKLLEAANASSRGVPVLIVKVTDAIMKNVIQDAVAVYDKEMEF